MAASLDLLAGDAGLDATQPVAGADLLADPNAPGPFKRGLGAGVAGVKSSLFGAGALAAHGAAAILPAAVAPVATGLEQAALANAQEQADIAAAQSMQFEDVVNDPTRAGEYFKFLLGNALPSLATMFVGGAAGRGLGALAGRGLAPSAAATAKTVGMNIGAVAPDVALEAGGIYPEALKTGVENPATRAAVGGAIAASADFVPLLAAERYLKPIGKGGAGAILKGAVKGAPVGAALEGSQELVQSVIERAAAGSSLTDPSAISDYINSFLGGAAPGSLFGAGIGGRRQTAARPEIVPNTGTIVPDSGTTVAEPATTVAEPATAEVPPIVDIATQHAAAIQQLAALEPSVIQAQQEHDALVARRAELDAESKLELGQRRTKSEITLEKRATTEQIKAAKAKIEDLGGQLFAARKLVNDLATSVGSSEPAVLTETPGTSEQVPTESITQDETPVTFPSIDYPVAPTPYQRVGTVPDLVTPEITPRAAPLESDIIADPNAPVPTEAEHIQRAVQGVHALFREQGMPLTTTKESMATPSPTPREVALMKVEQRTPRESVVQDNPAQMAAVEENAMTVIEPLARTIAATKTTQPAGQAKVAANLAEAMRGVVQEAAKLGTVEAAQQHVIDKLPAALKGYGVQVDAGDMAKAVSAGVGLAKTQYSKGATAAVDIDSPEFKQWFGDSKVVDEDGKPLVVYHGTPTTSVLTEFKIPDDFRPKVIWFSQSKQYSASYARRGAEPSETGLAVGKDKRHVIPVYLKASNVLDVSTQREHNKYMRNRLDGENVFDYAKRNGYDAVRLNKWEIVVFSPTQIKSTISNTGEFSATDPNITHSHAALTQETFDALPEPAKFAAVDAYNAVLRDRGTALRTHLTQLIGNRPELKVETFQAEPGGPIGSYTRTGPLKAAISMALNAKEGLSIADHEGYHYAEDWLLTSAEKRIVANALKPGKPLFEQLKTKLQQYDRENHTSLTDEVTAVPAEARAYGFEFWRRGELKAEGALARVWAKLRQFFERVANKVRGLGFTSMEDVFAALDRGQMAEREAGSMVDSESDPLFSKAATEMNTRFAAGELELTQQFQAVTQLTDNAMLHKNDTLKRVLLGPIADDIKGSITRWWMKNISTPNYIAAFSTGYKNVMHTLNRYIEYRETLIERLLHQQMSEWYHADFADQDAASNALLDRTIGKWTTDSQEYKTMYAQLTDKQKVLFDGANKMIAGFLDAELAVDAKDYKRYLTTPGAYDKWLADRTAQVQEMKANGYVPLRRYGDHTVRVYKTIQGKDGKEQQLEVKFEAFQHEAQAIKAAEIYKDEFKRQGAPYAVEVGIKHKTARDTTISVQQYLDTARRNGVEISTTERERLVLALTASESMVRNRLMMRSGMPGFARDGMRILNEFGVNMSGKIAYSEFGTAIDAAAEGRNVEADVVGGQPVIKIDYPKVDAAGVQEAAADYESRNLWKQDGPKSGFYQNMADQLADYVLVPDHTGGWSRNLRGAAMTYFIGGSISGAMVNTMSVPMMLVPQLSAHTNYINGLTAAMSAWKMTWQHQAILRDVTRLRNLERDPKNEIPGMSPELRAALLAASDKLMDTELHQIMSISQGQFFSQSRRVQKAMEVWMSPFRVSEQTNRITSFIAAYNVGKENGLKDQALFNFARDMVDSTQNNYSAANRPGAARDPVFALMFMFKSFPLFMTEAIHLMYKQNPKSAVFMLLGLTAMTGVQGLPFAETLLDLIDTISQQLFGSAFNSRRAMRNVIKSASEAFSGYDASDLVMRGMLNEIAGISAASRIGAGDFVPGSRLGTADADEGKILSQFAGAPYAMLKNTAANIGDVAGGIATGDWKQTVDALRAGGPIAVRNAIKGAEQLSEGYASDSKGRKIVDVSTLSSMLQMTGLAPAAVARAYDLESINIQTKAFYTQVSQDMQEQLINALRKGDTEKVQEINTLRNKWNEAYPTMPIMPNAAAVRRGIMLAGVPLDQRSLLQWSRRMRGENVFTENMVQ